VGLIGTRFGNYEFLEQIGEGGVGVVYRARDVALDRIVAIKALRPDFLANEAIVARFRSEAQTLARLQHPNIALLFSLLDHERQLLMVMEYVKGETFSALLRRSGALPPRRAVELLLQALDGIGYAHAQGVIHRDIKASNLMWSDAGQVKLMDFGIAIALGASRVTRLGHMVGTLQYMSPEQVRGRATDARSDLYSLGIVLYHLLAGRLPFRSENDYELMRAQVNREPPPLAEHGASVPPALEAALRRALAKDPDARYASAADFAAALAPILASLPAGAPEEIEASAAASPSESGVPRDRRAEEQRSLPDADPPSSPTERVPDTTDLPIFADRHAKSLGDRIRAAWSWEHTGALAALAVLAISVNLLLFERGPEARAPSADSARELALPPVPQAHGSAAVEVPASSEPPRERVAPDSHREALAQLGWAGPSEPLAFPTPPATSQSSAAAERDRGTVDRRRERRSEPEQAGERWIIRR
jgi:serine/threonine-protein kinase